MTFWFNVRFWLLASLSAAILILSSAALSLFLASDFFPLHLGFLVLTAAPNMASWVGTSGVVLRYSKNQFFVLVGKQALRSVEELEMDITYNFSAILDTLLSSALPANLEWDNGTPC